LDVVAGLALLADDFGVAISLPSIPRAMMPNSSTEGRNVSG
jgi:hypothetical protein